MVLKLYSFLFVLLFSVSCKSYIEKLQDIESSFFHGKFSESISLARPLTKDSAAKDRLLYLIETGIIFHTQGDYKKSNIVFKEADAITEKIKKSISKEVLAFVVNDAQKNFIGENYERVLIKLYIALNYTMLGEHEDALVYFRKINLDLKDMKSADEGYKQNLLGRYLQAILSEETKQYNQARVEYKNIESFAGDDIVAIDRYVLAMKEGDPEDISKYKKNATDILAFNTSGKIVDYSNTMGEVVILHQAGQSAVKTSRGNLLDDEVFKVALLAAVGVALVSQGTASASVSSVMSLLWTAENPIPIYKYRNEKNKWDIDIFLNNINIGKPIIFNDYSATAIHNYNDHYDALVAKNVASIATKAVAVAVGSTAVGYAVGSSQGEGVGQLVGSLSGTTVGAGFGATIRPDLRCWRLIPSNFQVKRIFLQPGEYTIHIAPYDKTALLTAKEDYKIKVESGKAHFINLRTF